MFWQYSKIVVLNTSFFEKIMEICIINAAYLSQICLLLASYMKQVWLWRRINDTALAFSVIEKSFEALTDTQNNMLHDTFRGLPPSVTAAACTWSAPTPGAASTGAGCASRSGPGTAWPATGSGDQTYCYCQICLLFIQISLILSHQNYHSTFQKVVVKMFTSLWFCHFVGGSYWLVEDGENFPVTWTFRHQCQYEIRKNFFSIWYDSCR